MLETMPAAALQRWTRAWDILEAGLAVQQVDAWDILEAAFVFPGRVWTRMRREDDLGGRDRMGSGGRNLVGT